MNTCCPSINAIGMDASNYLHTIGMHTTTTFGQLPMQGSWQPLSNIANIGCACTYVQTTGIPHQSYASNCIVAVGVVAATLEQVNSVNGSQPALPSGQSSTGTQISVTSHRFQHESLDEQAPFSTCTLWACKRSVRQFTLQLGSSNHITKQNTAVAHGVFRYQLTTNTAFALGLAVGG